MESAKQVAHTFIEKQNAGLSTDANALALAAALKFNDLDAIWAKWNRGESIPNLSQDSVRTMVSQVYQRTFESLVEGKMNAAAIAKNKIGKQIAEAATLAKSQTWTSSAKALQNANFGLGESELPGFIKDIKRLAELHAANSALAGSKLQFNSHLPKRIESRFNRLNGEIRDLKDQAWSHPSLARLARLTIGDGCARFVADLKGMKRPRAIPDDVIKPLRDQIDSVVDLVNSWREAVLREAAPKDANGQGKS
jgi:hypothetical protein